MSRDNDILRAELYYQGKVSALKKHLDKLDLPVPRLDCFNNAHEGKRIFVVAPGPSLSSVDLSKLSDEITIGVNGAVYVFDPTYFVTIDGGVFNPIGYPNEFEPILNRVLKTKASFIEFENCKGFVRDAASHLRMSLRNLWGRFFLYIADASSIGIDTSMLKTISGHVPYVRNGGTSLIPAVQFAYVMGGDPIYILGADMSCDNTKIHCYEDTDVALNTVTRVRKGWQKDGRGRMSYPFEPSETFRVMKEIVLEIEGEGRRVFCATPDSKLVENGILREVSFESLFVMKNGGS